MTTVLDTVWIQPPANRYEKKTLVT